MKNPEFYPFVKSIVRKAVLVGITVIFSFNVLLAERTITGTITDSSDGTPLIGAQVVLKGTNRGQITDVNGFYKLQVPNKGSILCFSYLGYTSREIVLGGCDTLNVSLTASISTLEEVQVLGCKSEKRHKFTCAVTSVPAGSGHLRKQPVVANLRQSCKFRYTEDYALKVENRFKSVSSDPLSTFSIDADRASYGNIRRFIGQGQLPPPDAVRTEELINYFEYNYPQPTDGHPFSINTDYTDCPWQANHKLLRIGLQGKKIPTGNLPASNLVFLIDVSGSMSAPNKLPLVKSAFRLLANNLRSNDRVAIVVYAGAAGVVLPSTKGTDKGKILDALEALESGGSTAGSEGIQLAYQVALENFIQEGNNRVILATDGDFNVGLSNNNELERLITEKRKDGIFLTCLGFGMGNYKDSKLEILADKGNGNYAYIDDMIEANKVFVNEFGGTLFTIAKDVKIQIEFNPEAVQAYRLIGYENRLLNNEDFKDDTRDAGELGAGHTVTALYEVIPAGIVNKFSTDVDELKYQKRKPIHNLSVNETATVKFRYKKPDGNKSIEMVHPIPSQDLLFENASENTRFAAAVAMFGMLLTQSEFKGNASFASVANLANRSKGADEEGYRGEFVRLVKTVEHLESAAEK